MNKIESFTFFRSYHEALSELCDRDKKALLVAITNYIFDDITPEFKGVKKSIWSLIEPHLKVSKIKANSAKKKSNQNQNEIKSKSNQNQNSNSVLSEKENKKEKKNKEIEIEDSERENIKREKPIGFIPPTLTEIINFAKNIDFNDEEYCERFYNHYQSVGWVNGAGIKIQDWKLLFKNWVKKDKLKEQEMAKSQRSKVDVVFDKFMEEEDD